MKLGQLAVVVLVTGIFAFACSDSSETLTLEEYFVAFEALDAEVDEQIGALFDDFPEDEDTFTNDDNLPYFQDLSAGFPRILGDFVEGLEGLEPPAEVEDEHNELVATGEELASEFQAAEDALAEAETIAEFQEIEAGLDPSIAVTTTRFLDACFAVVDVAIENNISVIITCQDDE